MKTFEEFYEVSTKTEIYKSDDKRSYNNFKDWLEDFSHNDTYIKSFDDKKLQVTITGPRKYEFWDMLIRNAKRFNTYSD